MMKTSDPDFNILTFLDKYERKISNRGVCSVINPRGGQSWSLKNIEGSAISW